MALGSLEVLSHRIFETKCVTQFLKADISKVRDRRATAQGQERSTFDHCPRVNGSPLKSVPRRLDVYKRQAKYTAAQQTPHWMGRYKRNGRTISTVSRRTEVDE